MALSINKKGSFWDGMKFKGFFKLDDGVVKYTIDFSALDFENLDDNPKAIEEINIDFDFSNLITTNKTEDDFKAMLYPHIPFFTALAKKEMDVLREKNSQE